jgi:hypothetical protein
MADRQCSLRSSGELKIEYVDEDELLVQGRQWNGGRYSFMID